MVAPGTAIGRHSAPGAASPIRPASLSHSGEPAESRITSYNVCYTKLLRGIVLCDELIRATVTVGLRRFDFLKGREVYKRRFGAVPRPLAMLEGVLP